MDRLRALLHKLKEVASDRKPAVTGVAAVAIVLLAVRRRHWLKAQADTWAIQLRSAVSRSAWSGGPVEWAVFQFEVWRLLRLDVFRRVELAALGCKDYSAGVPHVDTASADDKKKRKQKMAMTDTPVIKDLVLIGGGHSHAFVLRSLGMNPVKGVRVTLITRDLDTPYSGMLPGFVAGLYLREECHIDLARLGRFARATIVHAEAVGVDTANKQVLLSGGRPPVSYDVLSINVGSTPAAQDFSEATAAVTPVKPIDGFARRFFDCMTVVRETTTPVTLAVVGAGAGGVELLLAMRRTLLMLLAEASKPPSMLKLVLVGRAPTVMPSHNVRVQRYFDTLLRGLGVEVVLGVSVEAVKANDLVCSDGRRIHADQVMWCTQASTPTWFRSTGLQLHDAGFILVDDNLRSVNTPDVFAAGDCAWMRNHPRPRAGVFAVRAGPPLAANLRHALLAEPLEPHTPQSVFLGIIGTASPVAVASKGPMALAAPWLWELKDWIDRKWMASYTTGLPDMGGGDVDDAAFPPVSRSGPAALATLRHAAMRCGGCGSKVGAGVLSRVLARLHVPPAGSHVITGLESPDDCAVVARAPPGMATVHTVDFFRAFTNDPYVFGAVAANHALSDCHAMGATPRTALAIAVVKYAAEDKVEDTLYHMMAGALSVLKAAGCALVGGHSCEGADMALGFAVNGEVDPARAMRKSGMQVQDAIVLTKPVGTGALLAADMRCKAKAPWVGAVTACMLQSNAPPAELLSSVGATACTDVTGFGVIGHLHEMASASNVGVKLLIDQVPLLPGALDVVKAGIMSSLQADNTRLKRAVVNYEDWTHDDRLPLLFDPQTAGGLLATVSASRADSVTKTLGIMGYDAAVVGVVTHKQDDGVARIALASSTPRPRVESTFVV